VGVEGETFNLGTGVAYSVGEMVEAVFKVTGSRKPIVTEGQRVRPEKSEVDELLSDFSKAKAAFGFAPSISLETGLERLRDHVMQARPTDPTTYVV
jgi:nucleoside-diphosphate-sugar epimerase